MNLNEFCSRLFVFILYDLFIDLFKVLFLHFNRKVNHRQILRHSTTKYLWLLHDIQVPPVKCAPVASPVDKFAKITSPVPNYDSLEINE